MPPVRRVLIIDDSPDNLELVRFLVQRAGHTPITAPGARLGLELARQHLPDLILLDLGLPEMDGWQLAQALKADPLTHAIPIVALTAYVTSQDRRRALEAGCDGFLSKPIHIAAFAQELEHYFTGQGSDAA